MCEVIIDEELIEFVIVFELIVWWILVGELIYYEYLYQCMLLEQVLVVYMLIILCSCDGLYVVIYEVVLVDYVGMWLCCIEG